MTTSILKQQDTTTGKKQLLAKEVFSPQIKKFERKNYTII